MTFEVSKNRFSKKSSIANPSQLAALRLITELGEYEL